MVVSEPIPPKVRRQPIVMPVSPIVNVVLVMQLNFVTGLLEVIHGKPIELVLMVAMLSNIATAVRARRTIPITNAPALLMTNSFVTL